MKLKNICLGIACIAVVSACNDEMDYHEYTSYDKDYVFSDFSRTAGFVNNIYSYLIPTCQAISHWLPLVMKQKWLLLIHLFSTIQMVLGVH